MEIDFSKAKRGAVIPPTGKTRVTMFLDNDVLEHFRDVATEQGSGYQTLINSTLRTFLLRPQKKPRAKMTEGIQEVRAHQVRGQVADLEVLLKEVEELNLRVMQHLKSSEMTEILTENSPDHSRGKSVKT